MNPAPSAWNLLENTEMFGTALDFAGTIESDAVLPAQLVPTALTDLQPERRLLLAVLEDALRVCDRCRRLPGRRGNRLMRDTLAWFASNRTDDPFAFVSICHTLGLAPEVIRRRLTAAAQPLPNRQRAGKSRSAIAA